MHRPGLLPLLGQRGVSKPPGKSHRRHGRLVDRRSHFRRPCQLRLRRHRDDDFDQCDGDGDGANDRPAHAHEAAPHDRLVVLRRFPRENEAELAPAQRTELTAVKSAIA